MPVASDVGAVCCGVQLPGGDRATTSKACQLLHADFRQGAPTLRHDYAESAWFVVASRQGHAERAALLFALACLIWPVGHRQLRYRSYRDGFVWLLVSTCSCRAPWTLMHVGTITEIRTMPGRLSPGGRRAEAGNGETALRQLRFGDC